MLHLNYIGKHAIFIAANFPEKQHLVVYLEK